jgi:hypothetical protein
LYSFCFHEQVIPGLEVFARRGESRARGNGGHLGAILHDFLVHGSDQVRAALEVERGSSGGDRLFDLAERLDDLGPES